MEIRIGSKDGDVVTGVDQAREKIEESLHRHPQQWLQKLGVPGQIVVAFVAELTLYGFGGS